MQESPEKGKSTHTTSKKDDNDNHDDKDNNSHSGHCKLHANAATTACTVDADCRYEFTANDLVLRWRSHRGHVPRWRYDRGLSLWKSWYEG